MAAAKKKSTSPATDAPAFEEALSTLEGIIRELESDGLTLSQSLNHFENGVRLMRHCDEHLKNARGRLVELLRGEDGEIISDILGDNLEMFTCGDKGDCDG